MNDQTSANNPQVRTVTTTITCQHCGKEQEVTIEIPEETNTPKVVWND